VLDKPRLQKLAREGHPHESADERTRA
jgi:hypothetical protein